VNVTTRRKFMRLLTAMGTALLARAHAAEEGGAQQNAAEMHLTSDVMLRMRDGVHLAADIYRPMRGGSPLPGPYPVILERTPYGKTVVSRSELTAQDPVAKSRAEVARYFVSRGYIVIYSCRAATSSSIRIAAGVIDPRASSSST
jgi:predicted acyl esterase